MKLLLDALAYLIIGATGVLLLIGLVRLILIEPKMFIPLSILAVFVWALKRTIDNTIK